MIHPGTVCILQEGFADFVAGEDMHGLPSVTIALQGSRDSSGGYFLDDVRINARETLDHDLFEGINGGPVLLQQVYICYKYINISSVSTNSNCTA